MLFGVPPRCQPCTGRPAPIDGKPDQHLKGGDSYAIPAGVVHDARVHGDK
jgi:hypothetical protein